MCQRLTFLLITLCCLGQLSAQTLLSGKATLTGSQQVLPVATRASGEITVTASLTGTFTIEGSFTNLSSPLNTDIGGGLHVHLGYAGENGPVLIPLNPTLSEDSLSGTITAGLNTFSIASFPQLILASRGQLYVNLHTRNYPGGEIRGQVTLDGVSSGFVNLLAPNQNNYVDSDAFGALFTELEGDTLVVTGSFSNLNSPLNVAILGGTHLHIGLPGSNGGVDIPLVATLASDSLSGTYTEANNTFILTADQKARLMAGEYYVNLHSMDYPGGELRGQLLPLANTTFRAHLSGANEWPVVTTTATGQVVVHFTTDTLRVTGSFTGLSSAVRTDIGGGAHLHLGMAGQNGPVALPLALNLDEDSLGGTFELAANVFALNEVRVDALFNRGMYVNIHTANYPSGELRGQVLPESQAVYTAYLNGNQEIPAALTPAYGMVKIEKLGEQMVATGSFTDLSADLAVNILGGAHLHLGYPGQAGPVLLPLTVNQLDLPATEGTFMPLTNTFAVNDSLSDTLARRQLYVNIHSVDYPMGELRGQVLAEASSYFYAPLSSSSEPGYTPSFANGMMAAEVRDTVVTLVGAFSELSSNFAANIAGGMHLHNAVAGSNGGIAARINTEIAVDNLSGIVLPDSNVISLTADQLTEMLNRNIYVNVHSNDFNPGEIRGQMLPLAGTYFHTSLMDINGGMLTGSSATGGLKLELTGSELTLSGSVNNLESDFDESIAQGAHLHYASVGGSGPVVTILNPTVADDMRSVDWLAEDNQFTLADSVVDALYTGGIYANIHTMDNQSGEVRGQIRSDLNFRPNPSSITSPVDGAMLTLEGAAEQAFVATWEAVTDRDGDEIIYVWQLATDAEFTNLVFGIVVDTATNFTTDFGTVDALLADAGVPAGGTITVYHRVVAGDGSNHYSSAGKSVVLTRGTLVGVEDNQPAGFTATLYPTVNRSGQRARLEIRTEENFRGTIMVTDQLGRPVQTRPIDAFNGRQQLEIPTTGWAAGQYYVVLRLDNGRIAYATRMIVQ